METPSKGVNLPECRRILTLADAPSSSEREGIEPQTDIR